MTMAAFSAALEVVANLYDSFLTILLCTLYFGSRFEGAMSAVLVGIVAEYGLQGVFFACFAAGVAAFAGVMAWLNSYSVFEGFGGIFYSLVIVLYAWAALEGGIFQKLFFSLFWIHFQQILQINHIIFHIMLCFSHFIHDFLLFMNLSIINF